MMNEPINANIVTNTTVSDNKPATRSNIAININENVLLPNAADVSHLSLNVANNIIHITNKSIGTNTSPVTEFPYSNSPVADVAFNGLSNGIIGIVTPHTLATQ